MLMRGRPNGPPEALLARLCTAIDRDLAQAECELSERQRVLIHGALRRVLCTKPDRSSVNEQIGSSVTSAMTEWALISELFAWGLIRDVDDLVAS